ncbi:collagenase-like PrtC family protease [Dysgonomonadaceae bacterium PH5-43]|nr:collagenase-like PrtC family protease [Dysgonomonadaceae bacterium PH5-43]
MKIVRKIELLAPAKNKEIGIEAINHGADAIYIGAPKFSARSAAGNSLDDISELIDYAHLFNAKVYVAINTILKDSELKEVESLIWDLYRINADAIIIQDMGIVNLNLPPIAIHASTQTDNRTIDKVKFLEDAGFAQVVLARELSLSEIKNISNSTSVPLEVFVHGALCTSYSGQCYISQALSGRSANRGECAQYCRLPYNLIDGENNVIASNRHLLSLKDLNQSANLEKLLDAGVSSFKIEGRLKDISYVKNITAYYRKELDKIFERREEYRASSSGKSTCFFLPNPEKSFNRGFTDYFLNERNNKLLSLSPKSQGELLGSIKELKGYYFTLSSLKSINNGDGLCFINEKKEVQGFRVNKVDGEKIYPAEMPRLNTGLTLYRNFNQEFEKVLSKKSAERKISVDFILEENNFGFSLTATDEDMFSATVTASFDKELSQKDQKENIYRQLSKLGNTNFILNELSNKLTNNWFIPSSILSDMRRNIIDALVSVRKIALRKPIHSIQPTNNLYPESELDYKGNVYNRKAREFYTQHGVTAIDEAFEANPQTNATLMFTKYCIKFQLGYCPKVSTHKPIKEPLYLATGGNKLNLKFDCKNCRMEVITKTS